MIEYDVTCRGCEKSITLRVHDAETQAFFEEHGALCQECYRPGYHVAPIDDGRAEAWCARETGKAA